MLEPSIIKFNMQELESAMYDDFVKNENNQVISCSATDLSGNRVFIKNIAWIGEKAISWILQDKFTRPNEVLVMIKNDEAKYIVFRKISNFIYENDDNPKSLFIMNLDGTSCSLSDMEFDPNNQIARCVQEDENGSKKRLFDFVFDDNGQFIKCSQEQIKKSDEITFNSRAYSKTNLDDLLAAFTNNEQIDADERKNLLQFLTNIIQILEALKSPSIEDAKSNLPKNNVLAPRYRLVTPLLQVFNSMDNINGNVNGEKNLETIISILKIRLSGSRDKGFNPVVLKIANNLGHFIFDEVFAGNYKVSENGLSLLNLGFNLSAKDHLEALDLAIRHLYFNAADLLENEEILPFHYKKLEHFILIKV